MTHATQTMKVAETILEQLGGGMFLAMTGAKNLVGAPDSLTMKVGKNDKKVTHVRITLEPTDTYRVEFLRVTGRGLNVETLAAVGLVYVDALRSTFEAHTGLLVSL